MRTSTRSKTTEKAREEGTVSALSTEPIVAIRAANADPTSHPQPQAMNTTGLQLTLKTGDHELNRSQWYSLTLAFRNDVRYSHFIISLWTRAPFPFFS
jgi:hypothetical protein